MSNIAVSTSNLTKSFNGHKSVDNLSLSIPQGCIYGLLGPNGAGKTTTIRMLLGLIRPDGGDVHIFGQNLSFNREAILKNVGSLIETPSYYANLNAWENLKIICMMKQINTDEINPILDLVGLQNCGKKKVGKFSLGMKQRLAIAEALIGGPKLVILDEPVNGLDPAGIHEVREIIKSLARKSGITFLISSHLLNEMELMADKLGIIKDGKLLYEGDLQKLTDKQVNRITVGVSDLRKAVDYFKSVGIQVSIQEKDLMIEGNYSTEDISKRLMGQGIGITCIYKQNDSLENIYLRMMDGQSN